MIKMIKFINISSFHINHKQLSMVIMEYVFLLFYVACTIKQWSSYNGTKCLCYFSKDHSQLFYLEIDRIKNLQQFSKFQNFYIYLYEKFQVREILFSKSLAYQFKSILQITIKVIKRLPNRFRMDCIFLSQLSNLAQQKLQAILQIYPQGISKIMLIQQVIILLLRLNNMKNLDYLTSIMHQFQHQQMSTLLHDRQYSQVDNQNYFELILYIHKFSNRSHIQKLKSMH
ncbi:hypothetical protein ABPG72_015210 [Tetrahymena utriculariae]